MQIREPFTVEPLDATFGAATRGMRLPGLDEAAFRRLYETGREQARLIFPGRHPACGERIAVARRSLLGGRHAWGIPGLEPEQPERVLAELIDFAHGPPRVYCHSRSPGDAALWDNRCLLHRGHPWGMNGPRVMHHSRVAGDPVSGAATAG